MSIERVREYFRARGLAHRILEFDVSSATVELAAQAVGCEGKRIAKTLSFRVGDRVILIVTAGDARIDNQKYKAHFGTKARMLSPEDAELLIGHPVGGVCPFGLKTPLDVYLDISLKEYDTVFPAAGSGNSALKISPEEMKDLTDAEWVDVCKQ